MKIVLGEIPPWTFRSLCLILGGLGLLLLEKAKGLSLSISAQELRPLLLVAFTNVTGWHLCSAHGLLYMEAGRAAIIAFTMPVWAAIMGVFILGERLTIGRVLGLTSGIGGLIILTGPEIKALGSAPLGASFMLGAALCWGAGTVLIKYFHWTTPIALLTGWQLILGGIPVLIGTLILDPITAICQLSLPGGLAMAYIIFVPMIFCQWAWFKTVTLIPAGVASIGTLAIPIIGVFSSVIVLGETIGFQEMAALVLVVIGLMFVMFKSKMDGAN